MTQKPASPLPTPIRERHRPPIAKRVPANDHAPSWAGRGHVGAFIVQLTALVTINLAVWGFFAWWAMGYAERKLPLVPPGTGPL
ncbi:MAG: hypothetical protein RLO51_21195 [Thalassobaculum sp.]|uniref:hypothetical protein n=1 Tax=Thalassobaculum sp. TaxID=2022740 RepID=UPI0032ED87B6